MEELNNLKIELHEQLQQRDKGGMGQAERDIKELDKKLEVMIEEKGAEQATVYLKGLSEMYRASDFDMQSTGK